MVPPRTEQGFTLLEVLVVASVFLICAGVALPMAQSSLAGYRLSADARGLSQHLGVAKMRAATRFTRARVHVDLVNGQYVTETWNKTTSEWESDDAITYLSSGVSFGFGAIEDPPPNTQDEIGFSSECLDAGGAAIADTACIIFNSRGIPITGAGAPVGGNAFYLTDESLVYGTTVTATPLIKLWRTPAASAVWIEE
jgi:prepilin-type N-terminal cleavage/methylation domain-containing protein